MISSKPYQYSKGWTEFYKLKFKVNSYVLIPRPETELLVDEVLKSINNKSVVLDIGTGAGNIAVSVAKNSSARILASDISKKALEVARQNAGFHNVSDRIKFIQSNLVEDIHDEPDIIVTNLPYIPTERIGYLDSSVKDYEPHIALDGGRDGFELYRNLFSQIKKKGWQPRLIVGEIDYTHGELAPKEAERFFPEARTQCRKDLAYLQRILLIERV